MPTPVSLVWLFDVDGTLLLTQGAGRDALVLALRDAHGIQDDLASIPFAGRTDLLITNDIATRHGLEFDARSREAFFDVVVEHMRAIMTPPRGGLLPGVKSLLERVQAEPGWVSALLTGNESRMARLKLDAFGAWEHFEWGTFGEEGHDRNAIARLAVTRAAERYGVGPERCIVVGDTEHDVACARAAGARAVAVATGGRDRETLAACEPDLLLDDLLDHDTLFAWARAL
jgi:phosphoglycolate phosphatase-like HAD superfamily hydrolase